MDFAVMSARLNASTVLTSGLGAPARTSTPIPERTRLARVSPRTLPSLASASIWGGATITKSNASPALTRRTSTAARSTLTSSLCPLACSKSGASAPSIVATARGARTLISAASAAVAPAAMSATMAPAMKAITLMVSSVAGRARSVRLQIQRLHDRRPFGDVGFDHLGELRGWTAERIAGEPIERGFHVARLERGVDRAVEPGHGLGRGAGGREQAGPGRGRKAREAALDHRRQLGHERAARRAGHRKSAQLSGLDQRQQDGDSLEGELDVARHHVLDRGAAAPV